MGSPSAPKAWKTAVSTTRSGVLPEANTRVLRIGVAIEIRHRVGVPRPHDPQGPGGLRERLGIRGHREELPHRVTPGLVAHDADLLGADGSELVEARIGGNERRIVRDEVHRLLKERAH